MATGLLALLDDVAALVKAAAVSLDDVPAQIAKTSSKVSGVVIDDAAVTPKYVVGLSPKRELIIIYRIARSSLMNKLCFIAPAALVLGYALPWAITPILMVGGGYLCMEGYEKIHGVLMAHADEAALEEVTEHMTPEALEDMRIRSAVRTDLILSAEIIAIAYAMVAHESLLHQVVVLGAVAIGITIAVYGCVGILVKVDDVGLYLARTSGYRWVRACGRGLVKCMVPFLKLLGMVGTFAMLWVGGEIVAHGVPVVHHALEQLQQMLGGAGALAWLAKAIVCAVGGLMLGAVIANGLHAIQGAFRRTPR